MNTAPKKLLFIAECSMPTPRGEMTVRAYRNPTNGLEPIAVHYKPIAKHSIPLVRVHDACFTSETLGSLKCDCREQLQMALDIIAHQPGIIVYLPQEGRGIGLANKIAVYAKQNEGLDTVDANSALHLPIESRTYEDAAAILKDMHVDAIQLLTNNPLKVQALEKEGIRIEKRVPIVAEPNLHSKKYLQTKKSRMGHYLDTIFSD